MENSTKVEVIKDVLPVEITDKERLEFANELAKANQAVEHAIDEKKFLTGQANAKIKQAEAHRDEITNIVSSGKEWREVVVHKTYDYEHGTVTEKRTDTGEIIRSREMTDEERQAGLLDDPTPEPENDGKSKAAGDD